MQGQDEIGRKHPVPDHHWGYWSRRGRFRVRCQQRDRQRSQKRNFSRRQTWVIYYDTNPPSWNNSFPLSFHFPPLPIVDAPKIDKSPANAKSASDKGEVGTLSCKATGAPAITFLWSRLGTVVTSGVAKLGDDPPAEDADTSGAKYTIQSSMVDR